MTTTKFITFLGTVLPCGVLLLAALALYRMLQRRRMATLTTRY